MTLHKLINMKPERALEWLKANPTDPLNLKEVRSALRWSKRLTNTKVACRNAMRRAANAVRI